MRVLIDEKSTDDKAIWGAIDDTYKREGGVISARHCPVCGRLHVFTGNARHGTWQHRVWLPEPDLTVTREPPPQ